MDNKDQQTPIQEQKPEQVQTQAQPSAQPAPAAPAGQPQPAPQETSQYSKKSARKTLLFVGIIIAVIALLSVLSLLLIMRKSSVMIQQDNLEKQANIGSPTITISPEQTKDEIDEELESIDIQDSDADIEELNNDSKDL